ncbi:6142_t:CDS:2, partial [Gigaspora margarita]
FDLCGTFLVLAGLYLVLDMFHWKWACWTWSGSSHVLSMVLLDPPGLLSAVSSGACLDVC